MKTIPATAFPSRPPAYSSASVRLARRLCLLLLAGLLAGVPAAAAAPQNRRPQPRPSAFRMPRFPLVGNGVPITDARVGESEASLSEKAWLRYGFIHQKAARQSYLGQIPATVVALDSSPILQNAQGEIVRGIRGMLGLTLRRQATLPTGNPHDVGSGEGAIVLGTLPELRAQLPELPLPRRLITGGYWIRTVTVSRQPLIVIASPNDRGVLYGAFAFLRRMATHQAVDHLNLISNPSAPIRWVNEWDNLNGVIERGYGGRSIFFNDGHVRKNLDRVREYARLLASVGINGCVVNNVNADPRILSPALLPGLVRLAAAMRPWGVRMAISVDFDAPVRAGGLTTYDPVNPQVEAWWKQTADHLYAAIPDLAGFLVKAGSEGQPGPATYHRTNAQAANVMARALAPHHGILVYRAFVYKHPMNFNNLKADRAKAAWDNFAPLDGKFDSNVLIQIKNGPIDFQVREPASPLFAALKHTSQAIELEIAQEYLGQQRQLVFLVPMWKRTLDFNMYALPGQPTPVREIVTGQAFHRPLGGFVGVANVGDDPNWLGFDLAQANLYGFARLAWNPQLTSRQIIDSWTRQTFGNNGKVDDTIDTLQLASWHTYEDYTGPLGLQTLTNIVGPHYGPGPESADDNGWGQWIRAGRHGVGMDRTIATGTGYIGQYPPRVAAMYESLKTCPDSLVLFMHHLPYTYVLHNGKTVIQTIYDRHYQGAAEAQKFPLWWRSLDGLIDQQRYQAVLQRLEYQAGYSIVWRDAINNWFYRKSGVPDAWGRVEHHPDRVEAESMQLQGYAVVDVHPFEAASGAKAITCPQGVQQCTASFTFNNKPGWYTLDVQYFDLLTGVAHFRVLLNGTEVDHWAAGAALPAFRLTADASTRRVIHGLALRPGDRIEIVGIPQGGDSAAVDYVAIHRQHE